MPFFCRPVKDHAKEAGRASFLIIFDLDTHKWLWAERENSFGWNRITLTTWKEVKRMKDKRGLKPSKPAPSIPAGQSQAKPAGKEAIKEKTNAPASAPTTQTSSSCGPSCG